MTREIEDTLNLSEDETMACFGVFLSLNEEDVVMKQSVRKQLLSDLENRLQWLRLNDERLECRDHDGFSSEECAVDFIDTGDPNGSGGVKNLKMVFKTDFGSDSSQEVEASSAKRIKEDRSIKFIDDLKAATIANYKDEMNINFKPHGLNFKDGLEGNIEYSRCTSNPETRVFEDVKATEILTAKNLNQKSEDNSAVGNSNVDNSAVGNSNVDNSAVGNSNSDNSAVGNSNSDNPAVENSNSDNPAVENSNVGNSKGDNSAFGNSNELRSDVNEDHENPYIAEINSFTANFNQWLNDTPNADMSKYLHIKFYNNLLKDFPEPKAVYLLGNKIFIRRPPLKFILALLRRVWRYNCSIEVPCCMYALKDLLAEKLSIIGRDTDTLIRIRVTEKILVIINGRNDGLAFAKAKIYKLLDLLMKKSGIITHGIFSLKKCIKEKRSVYFSSKVDDRHAYFTETHYLNAYKNYTSKTLFIDTYKYNYLVLYRKKEIEDMMCENGCYWETISFESKGAKVRILGDLPEVNRCCKEIEFWCYEIYKIVLIINDDLPGLLNSLSEIDSIFYFIYQKRSIKDQRPNTINPRRSGNIICRKKSTVKGNKVTSKFKNGMPQTALKWKIKKHNINIDEKIRPKQKEVTDNAERNAASYDSKSTPETQLLIVTHRDAIEKILSLGKCKCRLYIEINKEIENFICGKKNGKIKNIIRKSNCRFFIDFETRDEKIIVRIFGNSTDVLKVFGFLNAEYPSEISFYLDERHHKRIIGHYGRNIQKMIKMHGVYTRILSQDEMVAEGYSGNVLIKTPYRTKKALASMKKDIFRILDLKETAENVYSRISHNEFYAFIDYYRNHDYKFGLNHVDVNCKPKNLYYYPESSKISGKPIHLIDDSLFLISSEYIPAIVVDYTYWLTTPTPYFDIFNSQMYFSYISRINNVLHHQADDEGSSDNSHQDLISKLERVIIAENNERLENSEIIVENEERARKEKEDRQQENKIKIESKWKDIKASYECENAGSKKEIINGKNEKGSSVETNSKENVKGKPSGCIAWEQRTAKNKRLVVFQSKDKKELDEKINNELMKAEKLGSEDDDSSKKYKDKICME